MNLEARKAAMAKAKALVDEELPAFEPPKVSNLLELRQTMASGDAGIYAQYAEINRITSMPLVYDMNQAELEEFNREHILADAFDSGFRLFPVQANAVLAYFMYSGLFGPIGVGWGKTLITLMIANMAYQKGLRKMLLFVPPQILGQLVEHDIKFARTKVPITYPVHVLGGKSSKQRLAIAKSGKKGLYIMPYSQLSTKDTDDLLTLIKPEIIIADEAHRIANERSARSRRVSWIIEEYKPECVFVSGTITSKSVSDYYHLIRSALGNNNPLPNAKALAHEWGAIIDAQQINWSQHPDGHARDSGPGPLLPLLDWARKKFPGETVEESTDGFRKAYRLRLTHAPGVVASGEADIGTSITFQNKPVQGYKQSEGWDKLNELITKVEDQWLTPNDDEIEHAIHTWKWLNELSAGFYNQLTWPTVEDYARRRKLEEEQAYEILEKAKAYHEGDQVFSKGLRSWLEAFAKPKLDTPLLVRHNISQHGSRDVGTELFELWKYKESLDFDGRPDRDSTAIRVCPYKINDAVRRAKEFESGAGIIWYHHQEVGRWLYEVSKEQGLDSVFCPAGKAGNERVRDMANRDKILVASITAHGEGKNLQHFRDQVFVQWPRSAKAAEQALGRLHRNGQEADEIYVNLMNTLVFDQMNFAACLNDALYIHQSTGVRQKLVYGSYDPLPIIFPSAVLKERGIEGVKFLNPEQQRMLQEKFG